MSALAPQCWDGAAWAPGAIAERALDGPLRVATWNLLFDRYDAERLRSAERWQDALDRLGALALDVIALVEITPAMWQRVLAQPWIRRSYAVTHAADGAELEPYGTVVLSRFPLRDALAVQLVRARRAVLATLAVGARAIGVAAVHLASDRAEDAPALRRVQLAAVLGHVQATARDAWIVAGDFNAGPEEHAELVADGIDAWAAARPDEAGLTHDVERNRIAAAVASRVRSRRIDRILAFAGRAAVHARSCELVGVEEGPYGLPPSDHYGVVAELAID